MTSESPATLTCDELLRNIPSETAARAWFEKLRWPEERRCPRCRCPYTTAVPNERPMPYRCPHCHQYFSVRTGTAMQRSNATFYKWMAAVHLMSAAMDKENRRELHRERGVISTTQAWRLGRYIRNAWEAQHPRENAIPVASTADKPNRKWVRGPLYEKHRIGVPAEHLVKAIFHINGGNGSQDCGAGSQSTGAAK